jgi:hypothetical protein
MHLLEEHVAVCWPGRHKGQPHDHAWLQHPSHRCAETQTGGRHHWEKPGNMVQTCTVHVRSAVALLHNKVV